MKKTILNENDQKLVDEYVCNESYGGKKKFRPWLLLFIIIGIVALIGFISRIVSYMAFEYN